MVRGNHAEIGGITPGSMPPDSTHVEEEGVLLDNVQLVAEGRFLETGMRALLAGSRYPSRNVEQNLADLRAQVAASPLCDAPRFAANFERVVRDAWRRWVESGT